MKQLGWTLAVWTALVWSISGCSGPELPSPETGMVQSEAVIPADEPQPIDEGSVFNIPQVEAEVVDAQEPMTIATADTAQAEMDTVAAVTPEPAPEVVEDINETVADDTNATQVVEETNATQAEVLEPIKAFEPYVTELGVLKVEVGVDTLRFMIKDPIVKYFAMENPERIVLDFKDLRYFEPMQKPIESPAFSSIATASHDHYNRVVIRLHAKRDFTIVKSRGDWLLSLKPE